MSTETILAIECSSPILSIALQQDHTIDSIQHEGQRQHSKYLLPYIESLCTKHNITVKDIDKIIVGNGPGSFIGVRLAHAVAQALTFSKQIPLITLSSLQIIAQATHNTDQSYKTILVAQDARKEEVYAALYQYKDGLMQPQTTEQLLTPAALKDWYLTLKNEDATICIAGNGWQAYQDILDITETAIPLTELKLTEAALQFDQLLHNNDEPNYVRNHVADLPKNK